MGIIHHLLERLGNTPDLVAREWEPVSASDGENGEPSLWQS